MNALNFKCEEVQPTKAGRNMSKQEQCPVCYNYIDFEGGAAYCFMCDEVFTEIDDGLESDLLDWINKQL